MLIVLLIGIPLLSGLAAFFLRGKTAGLFSIVMSLATFILSVLGYKAFTSPGGSELDYSIPWLPALGSSFSLTLNSSVGILMLLLTAIAFPLIFINQMNKDVKNPGTFYGLMLLAQAGLMGVFLANDAFLFYIFWELALIPVYFLSSFYGGPRRIPVTFKFFVYTFAGSLIMLVAMLFLYQHTSDHSFSMNAMIEAGKSLEANQQTWLFWMMFVAFAIKMPVFPFHTWQPDAYEQSATPVTMVLSAIMVKMGLFAVIRWLVPVLPEASHLWMNVVIGLSVIGIVYASCLAMVQTNIKRMIAYSSIAHIGLMCAAIFSFQTIGMQGVVIQMFNHGINIMGLWILVSILENRLQTQDMNEMGGIAKIASGFTIALVLISLANIALPLTNGFVGEFIMFNGLFQTESAYHIGFTVFAGLGVILSAVYTLRMIQRVALGSLNSLTEKFEDLAINEWVVLIVIMGMILWLGISPQFLMQLVNR